MPSQTIIYIFTSSFLIFIMTTISFNHNNQKSNNIHHQKGLIIEEIEGLIKVHKDGHVERPQIVPNISCNFAPQNGVISRDITINKETNLWTRVYLPTSTSHNNNNKLPLLVYFHGGGFCVGSAAWICYHEFLINLASKANCIIVSVNYRLAPENRLPSPYDDAFDALMWIKHEVLYNKNQSWWLKHCNISSLFLGGDSAGANIAYNVVATRLASNSNSNTSLILKGIILIQPFFGGEERTNSEKNLRQMQNSALSLSVSDTYWRLSLPNGSSFSRDHPYCNPLATSGISKMRDLKVPSIMICVSELDILRDRNLEFSNCLVKAGKRVETYVYKDVGHAFQVLHNYQLSHVRTQEMVSHINNFLN